MEKKTKKTKSAKDTKVVKATKATTKKELSVKERKKVSAGTNENGGLYKCRICENFYSADQILLKKGKWMCIYCASKM